MCTVLTFSVLAFTADRVININVRIKRANIDIYIYILENEIFLYGQNKVNLVKAMFLCPFCSDLHGKSVPSVTSCGLSCHARMHRILTLKHNLCI